MKNTKLLLKSQQRFARKNHNAFTEEVGRVALIAKDDERIQLITLTKTYGKSIRHMELTNT